MLLLLVRVVGVHTAKSAHVGLFLFWPTKYTQVAKTETTGGGRVN